MRLFGLLPRAVAAGSLGLVATAIWHYNARGLLLSHYDAKAHLVVARRILDSITPGWEQIGAVWLPLPHLLNMLPVQVDAFYRSGASAIALSVLCAAVTAASLAATVLALTGSRSGALLAPALFLLNPNVLYLHATPMTEPLLFALVSLQILLALQWVQSNSERSRGNQPFAAARRDHERFSWGQLFRVAQRSGFVGEPKSSPAREDVPRALGWVTVLACLTRYEAWPITAAVFVFSTIAWLGRGVPVRELTPVLARLALYPAGAVAGFMLFSRITVGEWFVSGGFFVPDPELQGQPLVVLQRIGRGIVELSSREFARAAAAAGVVVLAVGVAARGRAALLLPLALSAVIALPFSAYVSGHPFRMRYQIGLLLAGALTTGVGVGLVRWLAPLAATLVFADVAWPIRALDADAPMPREARVDVGQQQGRRTVAACLRREYDGSTVMVSMGSLAHFMHELSHDGFGIADFLHEGNGPLWDSAFTRGPAPLTGWVLIEESAEGGDAIAQRARAHPALLDGFTRVCEGGGVALYRRQRTSF